MDRHVAPHFLSPHHQLHLLEKQQQQMFQLRYETNSRRETTDVSRRRRVRRRRAMRASRDRLVSGCQEIKQERAQKCNEEIQKRRSARAKADASELQLYNRAKAGAAAERTGQQVVAALARTLDGHNSDSNSAGGLSISNISNALSRMARRLVTYSFRQRQAIRTDSPHCTHRWTASLLLFLCPVRCCLLPHCVPHLESR